MFYGPFINESAVVRKVIFSAWRSCLVLIPNSSHDGICQITCSLSCQGIFSCLLEAMILLNSMGNSRIRPQPAPLPRAAPHSSKSQGTLSSASAVSPCHSTRCDPGFKEPMGSNYLHKGDQEKRGFFSWSPQCHFAKTMQ